MTATKPSLNWYFHRLRAMNGAEIVGRAREKLRHTTEGISVRSLRGFRVGDASREIPLLPSKAAAPGALKQALAADAAKLLAGKWTLFGWSEVQVSSPPDWHCDYARGVSVPSDGRKPDHRALPGGADARAIWEINRWAEMVRLAMHGWLNDDVAAVRCAQDWLADWVEKNPVGQGINWTSALEGGLRLINFFWFDAFASKMGDGRSEIGKKQHELVNAIVPAHAWWVGRYPSFGSSANNHRLGELTGLLLAARRWPELEQFAGPADRLWSQIGDCVLEQFAEDGGNREQALHYHLFAFEMALHACRAMNVRDGPVMERLGKAAEFFVRMSHPQEPWDYGDSDDAQIVPLALERGKAAAEWSAWMKGDASAIGYWLGDFEMTQTPGSGTCQAPALGKCRSSDTSWWLAKETGMAVIERDGWKVRVDASPLGLGKMAAHGHCDALHVSIWDGEHALVIDPGTAGYFGSEELRAELASWNAHNGPQPVEGFKTPRRMGTFLWAEHHARPDLQREDDAVKATLQHEGLRLSRTVKVAEDTIAIGDTEESGNPFGTRWCIMPQFEVTEQPGASNAYMVRHRDRNERWLIQLDERNIVSLSRGSASRGYGDQARGVTLECLSHADSVTIIRRLGRS